MKMPKRIQRKRTKGWRMPPNTVYVGRPTKFGNMYKVGRDGTAAECVEKYKWWLVFTERMEDVKKLRGKDLACWCSLDNPCHADVLLELANNANKIIDCPPECHECDNGVTESVCPDIDKKRNLDRLFANA